MNLVELFKKVGHILHGAFVFAKAHGLTDEIIQQALGLVHKAGIDFSTNEARRAWVLQELTKAGLPESIGRLALELAVQEAKRLKSL